MNNVRNNYLKRLKKFIFDDNWIEPPLLINNRNKVLRFDIESKSETDSVKLIKNIFDDIFYVNSEMFIIFYGYKWHCWKQGKRYFKKFSLNKIFYTGYASKSDELDDAYPYIVVCLTKRNKLKMNKYLLDYLSDEQSCQMAFISLKKGAAIQMYDSRGLDLLSLDNKLLSFFRAKYKSYIDDEF